MSVTQSKSAIRQKVRELLREPGHEGLSNRKVARLAGTYIGVVRDVRAEIRASAKDEFRSYEVEGRRTFVTMPKVTESAQAERGSDTNDSLMSSPPEAESTVEVARLVAEATRYGEAYAQQVFHALSAWLRARQSA